MESSQARSAASAVEYGAHGSSLRDLPRLRQSTRRRASSWDRSGGNADYLVISPGECAVLADLEGAGCVNHLWMTAAGVPGGPPNERELADMLRRLVLRVYWDGADDPSILVPLGDFFGVGHARTTNFVSLPLQQSPEDGRGFNSFFHMPFESSARFEIVSEMTEQAVQFYYYIDYERYDRLGADLGRFHATWRRENPTAGVDQKSSESNDEYLFGGENPSDRDNYVILEATGRGHYVGCVLNVFNLRETDEMNWYGEGDDMILIDGESFPPSLHGTGTEDYFNMAYCPAQAYSAPYHGLTLPGGPNWSGPISMYRFHVEDPIVFQRSIRVSIEHGHANKRSDDLSSVAYWYQTLPHRPLSLQPVDERLPQST